MRNEERAAKRLNGAEEAMEESVFELPEANKKEFKFKSVFTSDAFKEGAKSFGLRNTAIVLSVLVIGAAVFVNWKLFGGPSDATNDGGAQVGITDTTGGVTDANASEEDYFAASLVERERARDEALEVLQGVVDDSAALETAKEQALLDIATMAKVIENESNIETLIKAKGFEECVAVINGDKANVIVKSEGLQPNDLSQIIEIVYLQAGILPENITIMEK